MQKFTESSSLLSANYQEVMLSIGTNLVSLTFHDNYMVHAHTYYFNYCQLYSQHGLLSDKPLVQLILCQS